MVGLKENIMKTLDKIQNHIINRIKLYCGNYHSIRGFQTSFKIHECYEPKYICYIGNSVCIGNNGHEVNIDSLDVRDMIRLFRFIVSGKSNF